MLLAFKSTTTILVLFSGVLLNEFFTYASVITSGEHTPRVRIYSAHDINVFSFMAATQITPRQGVPKYSSAFSLELRRVTETGKYVVLVCICISVRLRQIFFLKILLTTVIGCYVNDVLCWSRRHWRLLVRTLALRSLALSRDGMNRKLIPSTLNRRSTNPTPAKTWSTYRWLAAVYFATWRSSKSWSPRICWMKTRGGASADFLRNSWSTTPR